MQCLTHERHADSECVACAVVALELRLAELEARVPPRYTGGSASALEIAAQWASALEIAAQECVACAVVALELRLAELEARVPPRYTGGSASALEIAAQCSHPDGHCPGCATSAARMREQSSSHRAACCWCGAEL